MNEAPKKIWMDVDRHWKSYMTEYPDDIPYIRADLVDELVEAIELLVFYDNVFSCKEEQSNVYKQAHAALAKIKEET